MLLVLLVFFFSPYKAVGGEWGGNWSNDIGHRRKSQGMSRGWWWGRTHGDGAGPRGCAGAAPPRDAQPPPKPRGLPSLGRRLKVSFDSHTQLKAGSSTESKYL